MPPPSVVDVLPLTVVFVNVSVPRLSSPPPLIPEELAASVTLSSESVPRLRIPPPAWAGALLLPPPRTVRLEIVTLTPAPEGSACHDAGRCAFDALPRDRRPEPRRRPRRRHPPRRDRDGGRGAGHRQDDPGPAGRLSRGQRRPERAL